MKNIDVDNLPHLIDCFCKLILRNWFTILTRLLANWWGVSLGEGCSSYGLPKFRRHPRSLITIGAGCRFNSTHTSNLIGVNRPCIISTLSERAKIEVGSNCGFSGTVIGCASRISIGENVRCGANTLITDTDWHSDDSRTGPNEPVTIEKNVWLGINVIVLKGVTICENTIVGAGSVVVRSLPPNVVAGGVPAKVLRSLEPQKVKTGQ